MALALSLSFIPPIHIFGGAVYFVGIVTLAMPLLLRIKFALITGITSVVLADLISGWIMFTWISMIAYGISIILIWCFLQMKSSWLFVCGLVFASVWIIITYIFLEWLVFGQSVALGDGIATTIQMCIIAPLEVAIYFSLKKTKLLKNI